MMVVVVVSLIEDSRKYKIYIHKTETNAHVRVGVVLKITFRRAVPSRSTGKRALMSSRVTCLARGKTARSYHLTLSYIFYYVCYRIHTYTITIRCSCK